MRRLGSLCLESPVEALLAPGISTGSSTPVVERVGREQELIVLPRLTGRDALDANPESKFQWSADRVID